MCHISLLGLKQHYWYYFLSTQMSTALGIILTIGIKYLAVVANKVNSFAQHSRESSNKIAVLMQDTLDRINSGDES
jgi:hypothetical protein